MSEFAKKPNALLLEIFEQCERLRLEEDGDSQLSAANLILKEMNVKKSKAGVIGRLFEVEGIPIFFHILNKEEKVQLQCECISIIGQIVASGSTDQVSIIVDIGFIPLFIRKLEAAGTPPELIGQVAWAIGKLCEKSLKYCNDIIENGGLLTILHAVGSLSKDSSNVYIFRKISWAISTFFGRKSQINEELLESVISILLQLLALNDDEITVNVCRTVVAIAERPELPHIEMIERTEIPSLLVQLLTSTSTNVLSGALRAIGSILMGNNDHTALVVNCNILSAISSYSLLSHEKLSIRKDCCWIISNIAADSKEHIQAVLDANTIIPAVLNCMSADRSLDEKKEALWVISNIATQGSSEQVLQLLHFNVFPALLSILACMQPRIMLDVLQSLVNLLGAARDGNELEFALREFSNNRGEELLEALLDHPNEEIQGWASSILDEFYPDQRTDEES
jgi:hypothetical protein